jgi:coenzyme F420-reducing hydrogenase gamma subunit
MKADLSPITNNRTNREENKIKIKELSIMRDRKFSEVVDVDLEMTGCPTDILVY